MQGIIPSRVGSSAAGVLERVGLPRDLRHRGRDGGNDESRHRICPPPLEHGVSFQSGEEMAQAMTQLKSYKLFENFAIGAGIEDDLGRHATDSALEYRHVHEVANRHPGAALNSVHCQLNRAVQRVYDQRPLVQHFGADQARLIEASLDSQDDLESMPVTDFVAGWVA